MFTYIEFCVRYLNLLAMQDTSKPWSQNINVLYLLMVLYVRHCGGYYYYYLITHLYCWSEWLHSIIFIFVIQTVYIMQSINSSSKRTSQCNGWKNELLLFEVLRERRRDDVERVGGITLHSIKQSVRDTVSLAWHGICHTLAFTREDYHHTVQLVSANTGETISPVCRRDTNGYITLFFY